MSPPLSLRVRRTLAESPEYSPAEANACCWASPTGRSRLRWTARQLDLTPPTEHLAEHRGAFTTLHLHGKLRGCIGYVLPYASRSTRPSPRRRERRPSTIRVSSRSPDDEAPGLKIEISVLSPPRSRSAAEDVVVGKHGLVVTQGSRRGLLLPQVPVEWEWDRETFLAQTCSQSRTCSGCLARGRSCRRLRPRCLEKNSRAKGQDSSAWPIFLIRT